MPDRPIALTAYSGSKGEEIPRSFILGGEKVDVVSILDMWLEEEPAERRRKRCCKVRGSDGYTYIVYYDETEEKWFLGRAR